MEADLIDADFSLYILQALLDDWDEGCRGNQGSIDVGLADVAFYAKGECWVGEACRNHGSFVTEDKVKVLMQTVKNLVSNYF